VVVTLHSGSPPVHMARTSRICGWTDLQPAEKFSEDARGTAGLRRSYRRHGTGNRQHACCNEEAHAGEAECMLQQRCSFHKRAAGADPARCSEAECKAQATCCLRPCEATAWSGGEAVPCGKHTARCGSIGRSGQASGAKRDSFGVPWGPFWAFAPLANTAVRTVGASHW